MKIALYILTFIVCGIAAYYSLTLKEMFENQQQTRLETIDTNKTVSARADAADAEIKILTDELEAANLERDTQAASLESLAATGRNLADQVRGIESSIVEQNAEIARLKANIDEVEVVLQQFGENATPETITQTIASLEKERDELIELREEIDELLAAAERDLEEKRNESERIAERVAKRNAQLSLNATEAVITAVNHEWGFVLIGAGSNSGFAPQGAMIVQRDGRIVGRIRPSSIEPTQTVAEIDYSSLSSGVRLQPGDRVLLARPVAN